MKREVLIESLEHVMVIFCFGYVDETDITFYTINQMVSWPLTPLLCEELGLPAKLSRLTNEKTHILAEGELFYITKYFET